MENRRNFLKNQQGFTLVEIIAVLVILGILSAVAVPKFVDLQDEARERAVKGAFAAATSNVTLSYSQFLLKNGKKPTGFENSSGTTNGSWTASGAESIEVEVDLGDFIATYTKKDNGIEVSLDAASSDFEFGSVTPEPILIKLEFGEEEEETT
jgi:MSHA pilin protein MshA